MNFTLEILNGQPQMTCVKRIEKDPGAVNIVVVGQGQVFRPVVQVYFEVTTSRTVNGIDVSKRSKFVLDHWSLWQLIWNVEYCSEGPEF